MAQPPCDCTCTTQSPFCGLVTSTVGGARGVGTTTCYTCAVATSCDSAAPQPTASLDFVQAYVCKHSVMLVDFGWQADYALAALHALPPIAATVAGRVPILVDGGVRRGTDIIKARLHGSCQPSLPRTP